MQPIPSGGLPPIGADFNGILNTITALLNYQSASGFLPYDSTFQTSVGGYPKGATLLKGTGSGYWLSIVDNNLTNPDLGGAGWVDPIAYALTGYLTTSVAAATYTPLSGFTYGSNANGFWTKRPDGIIEQYGITSTFSAEGGKTITFPIAFTSSIQGFGATLVLPGAGGTFYDQIAQTYSPTLTSMGVYVQAGFGTATWPVTASWYATGI